MPRPSSLLTASVLSGLLAAYHGEPVAASVTALRRAPHVDTTVSEPNPATITAVSSCHFHSTDQYCQAGTTEFRMLGSATASSYTDCHNHGTALYCVDPTGADVQVVAAQATQTVTPTPTTQGGATMSLTAVSDCHLHASQLFCMAGTTEYRIQTSVTATATQDIPPSFTDCHTHGSDTYCVDANGDDVEVVLAGAEGESEDGDASDEPAGENCHFHAGVEHCVGGSEEGTRSCERVQRDYNIRLRIGLLFVILVTSSIGVFGPIFMASFVSPKHVLFTVLRQFGTGVIISTAFVHLLTHAQLMFQNECLGELDYESTATAVLMAGIFLSFLVEYVGGRVVQWQTAKARSASVESAGPANAAASAARTDMVNITVMEAGIIFHSLLIGLTLVVAGDAFFLTLFVVILFHQMFEGIALGTRIASLGRPLTAAAAAAAAAQAPGHSHAGGDLHHHGYGHAHFHPDAPSATAANPEPDTAGEQEGTAAVRESKPVPAEHDRADTNSQHSSSAPTPSAPGPSPSSPPSGGRISLRKKLLLAGAFALVTPLGMAIGIGALHRFNGNDPATVVAIGTLDAFSAGILVWVGVVEMWAHDWMLAGGEMAGAGPLRTALGLAALVGGMALMSLLGKWA